MDSSWWDQNAAWWAKAQRARTHIQAVASMVISYRAVTAHKVCPEATDSGTTLYRLRVLKPVPVELLTTIGDALHNLRSCLDSVAFELARRHLGEAMTERQEGAAQFPICINQAAFDEFLGRQRRRDIWGAAELAALLCAQPFALHDELTAMGAELATSLDDEFRISELARLSKLSNLDKHRRLPLLAWYADIIYMTGEQPGCTWTRRQAAALQDGDVIGHLAFPPDAPNPSAALNIEMKLALGDDPGYTGDVVSVLDRWHGYIVGWVLPRIFTVADGNPPPMAFSSS